MKRLLLGLVALAGCKPDALPKLGHGAKAVEMTAPLRFHEREGFTALAPPAHIPSSDPDIDQVRVWLKLGDGPITTQAVGDRSVLVFPEGTRADRVEQAGRGEGRFVADIRGTTLTADGPRFHVFRPSAPKPDAPLFGAQWPAANPDAHAAATDYLAERIAKSEPVSSWQPARAQAEVRSFREKNTCLPCHDPARPENTRAGEHGLVNRGTDGSGFFTPYTLFEDEVPLEQYGVHDRSMTDPLVDIVCSGTVVATDGWDRTCPQGAAPRARWRWDRAWAQAPTRAKQRCTQAEWLFERMDAKARKQVTHFFDNCANPHQD
ncbi:MAG: hypothetical protein ACE37F_27370 [Nannocystaceae bacterium]|nr:hypothetical protein [bacterium]